MTNRNFGKIEEENIKFAPNPLWIGDKMIANPTDEMYKANGYKAVQYTQQPKKDGYYFVPKFVGKTDYIVQVWEERAIQNEENLS